MDLNKRGGIGLIVAMMLGVVCLLLAMALAPPLKIVTEEQLNDPQLNCTTTTDSQTKAVCTSIDMNNLYVGIIFGMAGLIIWRAVL